MPRFSCCRRGGAFYVGNGMGGERCEERDAVELCCASPDSSRHETLEKPVGFSRCGRGWELCVGLIAALFSLPLYDSSRHETLGFPAGNPLSGPEPRFLNKSRGLSPFSRLVPSASSVDHQMTPALFARLFRASRSRLAHWRTGCSRSLRSRSSLAHLTAPDCNGGC